MDIKNIKKSLLLGAIVSILFSSCTRRINETTEPSEIDEAQANQLAELPLNCIANPYPYKDGQTLSKPEDLALPQDLHPAFYGCFDWHSAVHGHWSLVYLLKTFPNLSKSQKIREAISKNLTTEHIKREMAYFSLNKYTESYERTYGWAWLLKLSEELYTWEDPDAKKWYSILKPMNDLLVEKYINYLPKLAYPIRVGEHSNTAFGLSFAYDFAKVVGHDSLAATISQRAREFYLKDENCPISWEPSGYDFLSPCLQEMDVMRKVLPQNEFGPWQKNFLPTNTIGNLEPAIVKDRSDGKLVHLDGLNFSRAWCLYPLAKENALFKQIADEHLQFSLDKISDGDYMGEHWLGTFALYTLKTRSEE